MATVNVTLSFRVKDADGEIFSMPLFGTVDTTKTVSQINGEVANLATLIDAILDGALVSAGFCLDADLSTSTLKGTPVAGSEIERTGLIPFKFGAPARTWSSDLPAFKYSKYLTGTNQINMADTDVAAFTSAILTPAHVSFTDPSRGTILTALGQGMKSFRKHRGQTKRT